VVLQKLTGTNPNQFCTASGQYVFEKFIGGH